MRITVKLFGDEARVVGNRSVTVDILTPATCGSLRAALGEAHPELRPGLRGCRFAVNHEFVGDEHILTTRDEVALIGQVSGG